MNSVASSASQRTTAQPRAAASRAAASGSRVTDDAGAGLDGGRHVVVAVDALAGERHEERALPTLRESMATPRARSSPVPERSAAEVAEQMSDDVHSIMRSP